MTDRALAGERSPPAAAVQPVLVRLHRPEGYEDVHPELILQDANINPAFEPELVASPPSSLLQQAVDAIPLTRLDELARVYAASYASPHHFTMSVEGLRNLIAALKEPTK